MLGRARPTVKRSLDFAVSLCLLTVFAPVIAAIALAVAVSMGRPVLFRQQRPGLQGEPFVLCKFRTMRSGRGDDADRLTALGRFLRSSSLDELPELWNVVKGEMSLVGPRPLLMEYLPRYTDRQARRHEVRPGITGLAQVSGRNQLDWDTRLETDVIYIEKQTMTLDFKILAKTFLKVLKREGISPEGAVTMPVFGGGEPRTGTVTVRQRSKATA